MTLLVAADGSALGNPGPAGWAWYIDGARWRAGGWPEGTNNRGELMAVIDFLESSTHLSGEPVHFLCDSQYVVNSATRWMTDWKRRGWRKADGKPVLNQDLMMRLDAALVGRDVNFTWVRGHSGHALNEAADRLARTVAMAFRDRSSFDPGPGL